MITVVHFHSESGDDYLHTFKGEVDIESDEFWEQVQEAFGDETPYLYVVNSLLITRQDLI